MAKTQPAAKAQPQNTKPSPMDYQVTRIPNLRNERARLAMMAEERTREELETEAAALGIDTSGAETKADVVEKIRDTTAPR